MCFVFLLLQTVLARYKFDQQKYNYIQEVYLLNRIFSRIKLIYKRSISFQRLVVVVIFFSNGLTDVEKSSESNLAIEEQIAETKRAEPFIEN